MKIIHLTQKKQTIVDDDLYPLLNSVKWFANNRQGYWYAMRQSTIAPGKQKKIGLHHYIVGYPQKRLVVDHINGNTLDNRRENLRLVTISGNQRNFKRHRAGNYPGLTFHKSTKMWEVKTPFQDGKQAYIGGSRKFNRALQIRKESKQWD